MRQNNSNLLYLHPLFRAIVELLIYFASVPDVLFGSFHVLAGTLPTLFVSATSFFGTFNFVYIIKMKGEKSMSKIMWLTTGVNAQVLMICICSS